MKSLIACEYHYFPMNIIKSAKISIFLLKSVRDFNEFHTPRLKLPCFEKNMLLQKDRKDMMLSNA